MTDLRIIEGNYDTPPASGDFLRFNGTLWVPEALADADIPNTITLDNITQITNRSHTNLQDIGTNTHAQIDSHIADTSNPHSVTKAQVGLTNVTDDAQLKRAASDFDSFTAKATPVGADIILIEDSAAANAKKKVLFNTIPHGILNDIGTLTHEELEDDILTLQTDFLALETEVATIEDQQQTGWVLLSSSGTYVSSTSFTVSGDYTAVLQKGTKLRWDNTTRKYGYVLSVSYSGGTGLTTITIVLNASYTVANAAITDVYFSCTSPFSFPHGFTFTSSYGSAAGSFGSVSTQYCRFTYNDGRVRMDHYYLGTLSGASSNYLTFELPLVSANIGNDRRHFAYVENGGSEADGYCLVQNNSNVARAYRSANAQWTTGANRYVITSIDYET